jgi:hypothetical protein
MAFGGALHAVTPRVRRNVEPRHVKRHQAKPVMVQVARRRAGATIAHSAKVVNCLVRAHWYFVAHAGIRRTYIEDSPVAERAPGRIGIIDNQSEAFRAGWRATPDEWWRHVLAFARIEFWYTAIGWKGRSLQLESHVSSDGERISGSWSVGRDSFWHTDAAHLMVTQPFQ